MSDFTRQPNETLADYLQRVGAKVGLDTSTITNKQPQEEPLFRTVWFENLNHGNKKKATLSVRINLDSDKVIYTDRVKSRAEVVGFTMPQGSPNAGLFAHETRTPDGNDENNTYHMFRKEAVKFAMDAVTNELKRIKNLPDDRRGDYKPLSQINTELMEYLADKNQFFMDLQKQVSNVTSRNLPRINEYALYNDDKLTDFKATGRLPYNNPVNAEFTDEQRELVDSFLDTFLDEDNKLALSWYFGAALANVNIHDDRVSKMLLVSSARGGTGKSSLVSGLAQALFGDLFHDVVPSFDSYFVSNNRFATSTMPSSRLTIYSEADFCDTNVSKDHDFAGINHSAVKSLITDGYITEEKKTKDAFVKRIHGLHIVLSNYQPKIEEHTEALRRRILPVVVKASRMQDKAVKLGLVGQNRFNQYLNDNVQAFANYFVNVFLNNEYLYTYEDYDQDEFKQEIDRSYNEVRSENRDKRTKTNERISAVTGGELVDKIDQMAKIVDIPDISKLRSDITMAMSGCAVTGLRVENDVVYINSTKTHFARYGENALQLRKLLIDQFGPTVRKFKKRMIALKLES